MKILDLFSGIGGFSLGLESAHPAFETIAFCEIEKFPKKVLKKHWPDVPIAGDVTKLNYKDGVLYDDETEIYTGSIGLICGGYPCQPFSVAGDRRGHEDDRHLWPDYFRLVQQCSPKWVLAENVTGHVNLGLDDVLSDLEGEGYTCETFIIPVVSLDGFHRRDRLWICGHKGLANSDLPGLKQGNKEMAGWESKQFDSSSVQPGEVVANTRDNRSKSRHLECPEQVGQGEANSIVPCSENVSDTNNPGPQGGIQHQCPDSEGWKEPGIGPASKCSSGRKGSGDSERESLESNLGGTLDGVPGWMDGFEYVGNPDRFGTPRIIDMKKGDHRAGRLKTLGNAVCPKIPEIIGRAIMEIERQQVQ